MKWFWGIVLGLLLVFFMRDMAKPGLPMLHDSNPHISRAIAYHTAIEDGQLPPMWAKEVLGGIGSPVLMLNYQLPYMLGEIWHRLGLTYFDSYKFSLVFSFVLSGILMFGALQTKFGLGQAWVGALIYTLAPYRLVDIYVRGALGESLTFIFPPLLIWGYSRSSTVILIVGWAGLFLTHPVASAAFSTFFLGYCWVNKKKFNWWAYIVALLISAFNILPTLWLTKLTYYSPTLSDTLLMFPTLPQLFHSVWGYGVSLPGTNDGMSFEVGVVAWIVILAGTILAVAKKDKQLGYLSGAVLLTLFFILPISKPIYQLFLGNIIDFPWRLLLCVVFATAWMGAIISSKILDFRFQWGMIALITMALVLSALPIAHTDKYWGEDKDVAFFARETGDSYGEYAPLTRETRDSAPFGERAEFVSGGGEIKNLILKSNWQKYLIKANEESEIRINTAYFAGWEIPENCFVTKRSLSHIDDSGLIGCLVSPGASITEIKFVAPPVQKIGNMLTLLGIGVYLWILYQSFYLRITKRTR